MTEDRTGTSFEYNPERDIVPEATDAPALAISSDIDTEIRQLRNAQDAKSTAPVRDLNGGSHKLESSMPDPLIVLPDRPQPREYFKTLEKWRGRVLEVNGSTFRALLSPVTGAELEKEAEIRTNEIDDEDRHLLRNGAAFYWSVGYLDRPSGRIRASVLRFSRIPPLSSRDIARAKKRAKEYEDFFKSDQK